MSTDTKPIAAIVFVALAIRLLLAAVLGDRFHFADETIYVDAARWLWRGDGFGPDYVRVPGYPVLLAALGGPWGSVLWLRLAQAALAAGGAALGAAIVYALDPLMAFSAGLLYPEAGAALILAAAVLAAVQAVRRDSGGWAALTGVLLGGLALFRPVALALVPVVAAWIAAAASLPPARRARHAAAAVLTCVLVLLPWTYRNYQLRGRIVPVSLAGTAVAGISPESAERRGVVATLVGQVLSDPREVGKRVVRELGHFWELYPERVQTDHLEVREALHQVNPRLPTTPLAPAGLRNVVAAVASGTEFLLALLGLVVLWRRCRREAVLLAGLVLVFALGHSLFVGKIRYRITVLPLVFVFAGAGVATLGARVTTGSISEGWQKPDSDLPIR